MIVLFLVFFPKFVFFFYGMEEICSQFANTDFLIDLDDVVPDATRSNLRNSFWAKVLSDKPVHAKHLIGALRKGWNHCDDFDFNDLGNGIFFIPL